MFLLFKTATLAIYAPREFIGTNFNLVLKMLHAKYQCIFVQWFMRRFSMVFAI